MVALVDRLYLTRAAIPLALAAVLAVATPARAQVDLEPAAPPTSGAAPPGAMRLLALDAPWRFLAFSAPPLPHQLGEAVLTALDVAHGRVAPGPAQELPQRPASWPFALPPQARTGPGPLGAAPAGERCSCATSIGAIDQQRISALLATTTFTVSAAIDPRLLELRLRYRDGIAVWINGTEVVRRALGAEALWQLADRPRGPEWETVYLPVAPGLLHLGENVVAVELRPAAASAAPALALELFARGAARIVRGPMVQGLGETSATLVVETDAAAPATLAWGTQDEQPHQLALPPSRRHVWELRGLPANRPVWYRISAGASQTPLTSFHTLPPPGSVLRIGVYGDVRGGHDVHRRLTEALLDEAPDAVLVTGDMVLRGSDEGDWQRFFAVTAELLPRVPYYPAIGNHDLGRSGDSGRRADAVFALPPAPAGRPEGTFWYSIDLVDVHVVFLDSNAYERVEQLRWLEQDLAAARARGVRAILAVTHDGPFSRGIHRGNPLARERYVPVLAKYRVDLLLAGHDHQYQRGRAGGIDYIVSGGGGAALYPVTCGVPGRPRCKVDDGMRKVSKEHHYLMLTLSQSSLEICARRADRSALEPCQRLKLRR